jgi:Zn-dependent protease with chaperone function
MDGLMAIQFRCRHCEKAIKVRSEYAGRLASCPGCKEKVRIPELKAAEAGVDEAAAGVMRKAAPGPGSSPVAAEKGGRPKTAPRRAKGDDQESPSLQQTVLKQFAGPIPPVRRTIFYRVGVIVVAMMVVVLPVLYVSLIGLLGYGVYWHAVTNTAVAGMGHGRARGAAVMAYLAPLVAGGVAVLFMLKPLFARMPRRFQQVSLNRGRQPLLFAFVDQICDTVHAPRPKRIDLAFDINASAGFSGGLFSLLSSNLVLTIGMPLVAGLSLQQFAGILAHEFGHFSQGTAMRAQWIVMHVNMWFARIVYLRDEWDEWLEEASHEVDIRIGWILFFARFVVFLSRGVLWCFMMLSHALSCGMSRLMEYDADRYEIRLAGTENFIATSKRLHQLNYGAGQFFRALYLGKIQESSGNLARDMVNHCEKLDWVDEKRMKRRLKKEKTGWFDTHPSTNDRIAAAKRENATGVFHCELPADVVFNGFDELCLSLQRRPG